MKSSITGCTPHEAKQTDNHMDVKFKLELHAKKERKYPDINVGDSVRVYQKKKIFDKDSPTMDSRDRQGRKHHRRFWAEVLQSRRLDQAFH